MRSHEWLLRDLKSQLMSGGLFVWSGHSVREDGDRTDVSVDRSAMGVPHQQQADAQQSRVPGEDRLREGHRNAHCEYAPHTLPSYFQYQLFLASSGILFQVTSKIRHFLPRFRHFFQDQAFYSKVLPRSGIFFRVTSKIRHFLPSYLQDQAFSSNLLPRFRHFLQDQTFSSKILARITYCLPRS